MGHFVTKCACGQVLARCRCMSLEKEVRYVTPCTHYFATYTITRHDPITENSVLEVLTEYAEKSSHRPDVLKCSPAVYAAMRMYFWLKEEELIKQGVKRLPVTDFNPFAHILGLLIQVDHTLAKDEWRVEDVHKAAQPEKQPLNLKI